MDDESTIERLRRFLGTEPSLRLAILFGSLSSGRATSTSDIDLALGFDQALTAEHRLSLIAALAELTGRAVDLVDLSRVGEPLLGQILKGGRRLYGSDADYGALISRHLFDQADFLPYRDRLLAMRREQWISP